MNFNSNPHPVYLCAHVRAYVAKSSFESEIADGGVFFESQKYLEFAVSVRVAFALGEFAGNRIEVREMADARTTGFEEDRVSADVADEKAMMFECEVGCDELAV